MSMFAKVFIVVNLLLTVALTFLMATLLAQKSDYKARWRVSFKEARVVTDELGSKTKDFNAQTRHKRLQMERKRINRTNLEVTYANIGKFATQQQASLSKLRSEVSALERSWGSLDGDHKRLVARRTGLQSQIKLAREQRETAVGQRKSLKSQRSTTDGEILKIQEQVNDQAKLVIKRALETQELVLLVEMIKERYPDLDIAEQIPLVKGKIKSIEGSMVTLTIGEVDGVEVGFPFTVYRGRAYIGRVVVETLLREKCVARIDTSMQSKNKIMVGDTVTTDIK